MPPLLGEEIAPIFLPPLSNKLVDANFWRDRESEASTAFKQLEVDGKSNDNIVYRTASDTLHYCGECSVSRLRHEAERVKAKNARRKNEQNERNLEEVDRDNLDRSRRNLEEVRLE